MSVGCTRDAQLRSVERMLRQDNGIIHGLMLGGEPVETAAQFIGATLGVASVDVIDAYWLGRPTDAGTPRKCPLLVRFRSARAKREAQRKCREVRPKGVYVDDDLSAEERAVRVKKRMAKKLAENTPPSDGPSTLTTAAAPQHHELPAGSPLPAPSPPRPSTSAPPGAAAPAGSAQPVPKPVAKDAPSRSPPLPAAKRARLVTNPARRQQLVPKAPRGRRKPVSGLRDYFSRPAAATPDDIRRDEPVPPHVISPIDRPRSPSPAAPSATPWSPPPPGRAGAVVADPGERRVVAQPTPWRRYWTPPWPPPDSLTSTRGRRCGASGRRCVINTMSSRSALRATPRSCRK